MQNAHDAQPAPNSLIVSIKYRPGKLVFLHNGSGFKTEQIYHLIFHGSTKFEDEETTGQYGSGFLTTHLLSSEIDVSGQLDDGKWFNFFLVRKPDSVDALRESMDQAWEDFNPSSSLQVRIPTPFTTRFVYPIIGVYAEKAVVEGIKTLEQCAPYVVAFNRNFARIEIDIDIKARCEHLCFKVRERIFLDEDRIQQITVVEGKSRVRKYLRAQGEPQGKKETSVAVPLESNGDSLVCLRVGETPRLFKDMPLVGTESFSFPAVINSFKFSPTEDRNEVRLGQNQADPANINNQTVIEEACGLLVHLLGYAASERWHHAHQWAEISPIEHPVEETRSWLRKRIQEKFIEKIRQTPVIVTEAGQAIKSKDATLPLEKTDEGVEELWDLLYDLQEYREKLPRRDEATGWCNTIKSWADVYEDEPECLFSEVMDGRKLASYIDDKTRKGSTWGKIKDLQSLLREEVSAVEWLNQLHNFFNENGLHDVGSEYRIVMDQDGFLDRLSNLHCDRGIDEELKDIAELLDWPIRQELRDTRLTSLAKEGGKGERENKDILGDLISDLREHAKDPDDNFKEVSARLFAWIVDQEDWERLRGFPVFAKDGNSILDLPTAHGGEPPLAPVCAWPEGLGQFADLFPPDCILADDFKVCAPGAWEQLDKHDLIRKSMIITRNETDLKTLSPDINQDEGTHETTHCITVTDVVEWKAIMRRVSVSRSRAFLFWRFLTEWLIKEHGQGLEMQKAPCTCEEDTHEYYPAAWLIPLRENNWIRLGNKHPDVTAQLLANLLRDNEWEPGSLSKNPNAIKLLEAIGVNLSDLNLHLITENDEERNELVNSMTELHHVTQGNLNQIRALVQHLKKDQEREHIVDENRRLGQEVEDWVQASLEQEGFSVRRTGTGSDFEISDNTNEDNTNEDNIDDMITLDIARGSKNWLVEVKATRRTQSVKMSSKQAQTAVEKRGEFLLCIVPVGSENTEPDLETVRENMRFIKNIYEKLGSRVATLCESIEKQEEVLANTPDDTASGVDLNFEAGKAPISVVSSVWENDGFPLKNLAEQLK